VSPLVSTPEAGQIRAWLRKVRDPATRSALNDAWQRHRAQTRRRTPTSSGPRRPDACWMAQPRPRVTRVPKGYRSESDLALRRRLRREEAHKRATGP